MEKTELYAQLEIERDHSAFLEKLLRVLCGEGWNKLTIDEAKKWHKLHILNQPKEQIPGQLDICKTCAAKKLFDESLK